MNFDQWPVERLRVLHRVAKTRGYAFFRDPRHMIALRDVIARKEGSIDPEPKRRRRHAA